MLRWTPPLCQRPRSYNGFLCWAVFQTKSWSLGAASACRFGASCPQEKNSIRLSWIRSVKAWLSECVMVKPLRCDRSSWLHQSKQHDIEVLWPNCHQRGSGEVVFWSVRSRFKDCRGLRSYWYHGWERIALFWALVPVWFVFYSSRTWATSFSLQCAFWPLADYGLGVKWN